MSELEIRKTDFPLVTGNQTRLFTGDLHKYSAQLERFVTTVIGWLIEWEYFIKVADTFYTVNPERLSLTKLRSDSHSLEAAVNQRFNDDAFLWTAIETPFNYKATIETFLRFFPTSSVGTILSLGSGPGVYESFLAFLLKQEQIAGKIISTDFAQGMNDINRRIAGRTEELCKLAFHERFNNHEVQYAHCAALPFPDGYANHILCNNMLQWVVEWKLAVAEMVRVLNPIDGYVHIFVHGREMSACFEDKKVQIETFMPSTLLDHLESVGFEIHHIRLLQGDEGVGQGGGTVKRTYILAKLTNEKRPRWRELFSGNPSVVDHIK
jgi:SAM-dependent methyltransferase